MMDYWIHTKIFFFFFTLVLAGEKRHEYLIPCIFLRPSPVRSFPPPRVGDAGVFQMYHLVHQYTHLHVVAAGVCFSEQSWIQQVFRCGFGALLGSECISSVAEGRLGVWLQVRVETQRLRFQSGSTVVLHRPSEVRV